MEVAPGTAVEVATVATLATAAVGVAAAGALHKLHEERSSHRVGDSSSANVAAVHTAPESSNSFQLPEALRRKTIFEKRKKEINDAVPWVWPALAALNTCISVGLYGYDTFTDWDLFFSVARVTACDVAEFAWRNESLSAASQRCFATENATAPCARHYWNVMANATDASPADFATWKSSQCSGPIQNPAWTAMMGTFLVLPIVAAYVSVFLNGVLYTKVKELVAWYLQALLRFFKWFADDIVWPHEPVTWSCLCFLPFFIGLSVIMAMWILAGIVVMASIVSLICAPFLLDAAMLFAILLQIDSVKEA